MYISQTPKAESRLTCVGVLIDARSGSYHLQCIGLLGACPPTLWQKLKPRSTIWSQLDLCDRCNILSSGQHCPSHKKNEQIRVCLDFGDLNKASHKDEFPIPHIELLKQAAIRYEALYFMDRYSRYNQIKMQPSDAEMTTF